MRRNASLGIRQNGVNRGRYLWYQNFHSLSFDEEGLEVLHNDYQAFSYLVLGVSTPCD
jgi:hypothetical protein